MIESENTLNRQPDQYAAEEYRYLDDEPHPEPQVSEEVLTLFDYMQMDNIAEALSDSKLTEIGVKISDGYDTDLESREEQGWNEQYKRLMKLAKLIADPTTTDNEIETGGVVYPMIATAAIQFASRALPNIIKGKDVVKFATIGKDPDGTKESKAHRLGEDMSYQLLYEMSDWVDDMDQLLLTLPIIGVCFKKTYVLDDQAVSEVVMPKDLVVDYYAKSLKKAARVTHRLEMTKNEIIESQRAGIFLDHKLDELGEPEGREDGDRNTQEDETSPYILLEQHCRLDLDEDGYEEPYVVTVHPDSHKVFRIVARWNESGIMIDEESGIIRKIQPIEYFTRFQFMPSPDGSFYCMGFGTLLQPLNEAVNTILLQLIESGEAANWPMGFIGNEVQMNVTPAGARSSMAFRRREFKRVRCSGDDLRKGIVQIPMPQPSPVLFQLLQFLLEAADKLSAVSNILSGEMPSANTPVGTTTALIEQGLKVFSGIYGRIHRALKKEYKKIRLINQNHRDQYNYQVVMDDEMANVQEDYQDEGLDVFPISDPANASDTQRILKAQALMELRGQGFNDQAIMKRFLEDMNIENSEELLPEQPEPDPLQELELQIKQAELAKINAEAELVAEKIRTEQVDQRVKAEGVELDKRKMKVEEARTANDIRRGVTDDEMKVKESEMKGKTAEKADQGPYREKGMKSNNKKMEAKES